MKNLLISIFALLLVSSVVFAADVIVATDASNVDTMTALAAGNKAGVPVLIANNNEIDANLKTEIANLNANNVVVVGGPEVVTESSVSSLNKKVRLWGIQRTQTALEVAKHFWSEGADCAFLGDDAKDSNVDHMLQRQAVRLAVANKCPFIPIPKGSVPSEVLTVLSELSVKKVYFISESSIDSLIGFNVEVVSKNNIENFLDAKLDKNATKLVIVAAPDWRLAIGVSAHTRDNTVVKFVTNDSVDNLISLIKSKNITDVKVVGKPDLADKVAAKLETAGINVTKVSGEKASEIAKKIADKEKQKWNDKEKKAKERLQEMKSTMKEKLLDKIEKAQQKLDERESELEQLKANGTDVSNIQAKIDLARTRLAEAKTRLETDLDEGNMLISSSLSEVESVRFDERVKLKLDLKKDQKQEEETEAELKSNLNKISDLEEKIDSLPETCKQRVKSLVDKAKDLKSQSDKSERAKAIVLTKQSAMTLRTAENTIGLCVKQGRLSERLNKALEDRDQRLKPIVKGLAAETRGGYY